MILAFPDSQIQAEALAQTLKRTYAVIDIHRFPDGESKLTLPTKLPRKIIIFCSLHQPNNKLIELLLCCNTARQQGVQHITLVTPYLCYMRQDIAFHPGEAVSQTIIGHWLGELFDAVITVDPHLHRIEHLSQAIPNTQAIALQAMPAMAEFLQQRFPQATLIGPDAESRQWVSRLAEQAGLAWGVAEKVRSGDYQVEVALPDINIQDQDIILVDDIISTGRTLKQAAMALRSQGARSVHALVVHALFADDQDWRKDLALDGLWSSDSIPHSSNAFALTALLAAAVSNIQVQAN